MDSDLDKERTAEYLRSRLPSWLRSQNISPDRAFTCLNPAHINGVRCMRYKKEDHTVICDVCGAVYDIFDLVGMQYGIRDPEERYKKLYEMYIGPASDTLQQGAMLINPKTDITSGNAAKSAMPFRPGIIVPSRLSTNNLGAEQRFFAGSEQSGVNSAENYFSNSTQEAAAMQQNRRRGSSSSKSGRKVEEIYKGRKVIRIVSDTDAEMLRPEINTAPGSDRHNVAGAMELRTYADDRAGITSSPVTTDFMSFSASADLRNSDVNMRLPSAPEEVLPKTIRTAPDAGETVPYQYADQIRGSDYTAEEGSFTTTAKQHITSEPDIKKPSSSLSDNPFEHLSTYNEEHNAYRNSRRSERRRSLSERLPDREAVLKRHDELWGDKYRKTSALSQNGVYTGPDVSQALADVMKAPALREKNVMPVQGSAPESLKPLNPDAPSTLINGKTYDFEHPDGSLQKLHEKYMYDPELERLERLNNHSSASLAAATKSSKNNEISTHIFGTAAGGIDLEADRNPTLPPISSMSPQSLSKLAALEREKRRRKEAENTGKVASDGEISTRIIKSAHTAVQPVSNAPSFTDRRTHEMSTIFSGTNKDSVRVETKPIDTGRSMFSPALSSDNATRSVVVNNNAKVDFTGFENDRTRFIDEQHNQNKAPEEQHPKKEKQSSIFGSSKEPKAIRITERETDSITTPPPSPEDRDAARQRGIEELIKAASDLDEDMRTIDLKSSLSAGTLSVDTGLSRLTSMSDKISSDKDNNLVSLLKDALEQADEESLSVLDANPQNSDETYFDTKKDAKKSIKEDTVKVPAKTDNDAAVKASDKKDSLKEKKSTEHKEVKSSDGVVPSTAKKTEQDKSTDYWCRVRKLDPDTVSAFGLSFNDNFSINGDRIAAGIIPLSHDSFSVYDTATGQNYLAGRAPKCFNIEALNRGADTGFVFAVSSALDALTLESLGFPAVALCRHENAAMFTEAVTGSSVRGFTVIVACENGQFWQAASSAVCASLQAANIPCVKADLLSPFTDFSQAVQQDRSALLNRINRYMIDLATAAKEAAYVNNADSVSTAAGTETTAERQPQSGYSPVVFFEVFDSMENRDLITDTESLARLNIADMMYTLSAPDAAVARLIQGSILIYGEPVLFAGSKMQWQMLCNTMDDLPEGGALPLEDTDEDDDINAKLIELPLEPDTKNMLILLSRAVAEARATLADFADLRLMLDTFSFDDALCSALSPLLAELSLSMRLPVIIFCSAEQRRFFTGQSVQTIDMVMNDKDEISFVTLDRNCRRTVFKATLC